MSSRDRAWNLPKLIALSYRAHTNKVLGNFREQMHGLLGWKAPAANMPMIKSIFEAVVNLAKQTFQLPHFAAVIVKQRRRRFAVNRLEAERLDRIRNPSKYLGK